MSRTCYRFVISSRTTTHLRGIETPSHQYAAGANVTLWSKIDSRTCERSRMPPISRRDFIRTASSSAVFGAIVSTGSRLLHANPLGLPLGCETWPVRAMIAKDSPGTLKQLAADGFQTIELCSPVGYADSGFAGLAKFKGSELRSILHEEGLTCVSSHFSMDELRKNQEDRISWAKD